ncbi:MAG: HD domain-containing protein [Thiolinea sp.]
MQHSQLVNTESRDLTSWIERLWISGHADDRARLEPVVRALLDPGQNDSQSLFPNSLDVAETLRTLDVDQTTLTAALLSDNRFLQTLELKQIGKDYGKSVATLCESMRMLHHFRESTQSQSQEALSEKQQAEQVRRMLLAMVKDVRAVLIKLVWHLQYLRLLARHNIGPQHLCAAHQTMDIYAPITNRLGVSHIKWEMEDLAFRFLEPGITKASPKNRCRIPALDRELTLINEFILLIRTMMQEAGVAGDPL